MRSGFGMSFSSSIPYFRYSENTSPLSSRISHKRHYLPHFSMSLDFVGGDLWSSFPSPSHRDMSFARRRISPISSPFISHSILSSFSPLYISIILTGGWKYFSNIFVTDISFWSLEYEPSFIYPFIYCVCISIFSSLSSLFLLFLLMLSSWREVETLVKMLMAASIKIVCIWRRLRRWVRDKRFRHESGSSRLLMGRRSFLMRRSHSRRLDSMRKSVIRWMVDTEYSKRELFFEILCLRWCTAKEISWWSNQHYRPIVWTLWSDLRVSRWQTEREIYSYGNAHSRYFL